MDAFKFAIMLAEFYWMYDDDDKITISQLKADIGELLNLIYG